MDFIPKEWLDSCGSPKEFEEFAIQAVAEAFDTIPFEKIQKNILGDQWVTCRKRGIDLLVNLKMVTNCGRIQVHRPKNWVRVAL